MMKFKNTLIIFLGIIAIIFAGCKEKKATHESGIIAEPQKSETYEENGISYKKEKYFIFTKMTVLSAVVAFIFAYSLQKSVLLVWI